MHTYYIYIYIYYIVLSLTYVLNNCQVYNVILIKLLNIWYKTYFETKKLYSYYILVIKSKTTKSI